MTTTIKKEIYKIANAYSLSEILTIISQLQQTSEQDIEIYLPASFDLSKRIITNDGNLHTTVLNKKI